jgi:hypothetical protein
MKRGSQITDYSVQNQNPGIQPLMNADRRGPGIESADYADSTDLLDHWTTWSLVLSCAVQVEEERDAEEGGDDAQGQDRGREPGQDVGEEQEAGAEQERGGHGAGVVRAEDEPGNVRHDQADEADGAGERDHDSDQER